MRRSFDASAPEYHWYLTSGAFCFDMSFWDKYLAQHCAAGFCQFESQMIGSNDWNHGWKEGTNTPEVSTTIDRTLIDRRALLLVLLNRDVHAWQFCAQMFCHYISLVPTDNIFQSDNYGTISYVNLEWIIRYMRNSNYALHLSFGKELVKASHQNPFYVSSYIGRANPSLFAECNNPNRRYTFYGDNEEVTKPGQILKVHQSAKFHRILILGQKVVGCMGLSDISARSDIRARTVGRT
ncbi:uncharacterized protein LOC116350983 [Contarinia nasturtii]|uniref:uncharacterized protein LOC116350983 n=1 Tax=Contarinia nasturtii TaxID=265458 RepID=UPI0012D41BCD|nr:uncharacterized protein LOC116350983 [Contarinia nasturtii]